MTALSKHLLQQGSWRCFNLAHVYIIVRVFHSAHNHVLRLYKVIVPLLVSVHFCILALVNRRRMSYTIFKNFLTAPSARLDIVLVCRDRLRCHKHFLKSIEVGLFVQLSMRNYRPFFFWLRSFPWLHFQRIKFLIHHCSSPRFSVRFSQLLNRS